MSKACLVDTTKCIGCRACQVACKEWNELPAEKTRLRAENGYENPPALSAKTYTRVTFHEIHDDGGGLERFAFAKTQCMHCLKPACVSACPVGALEQVKRDGKAAGPVIYHWDKCLGCRYCMLACPFSVPTFEWDKRVPKIQKCTFCADRILEPDPDEVHLNGAPLAGEPLERFRDGARMPACAKACPTGAIVFGEREELIAEAGRRIEDKKKQGGSWQYVDRVYGEKEVGGTSWLYVSSVPFAELGFRTDLGDRPYAEHTQLALDAVPPAVVAIGVALGALHWFSNRRSEVEKGAGPAAEAKLAEEGAQPISTQFGDSSRRGDEKMAKQVGESHDP